MQLKAKIRYTFTDEHTNVVCVVQAFNFEYLVFSVSVVLCFNSLLFYIHVFLPLQLATHIHCTNSGLGIFFLLGGGGVFYTIPYSVNPIGMLHKNGNHVPYRNFISCMCLQASFPWPLTLLATNWPIFSPGSLAVLIAFYILPVQEKKNAQQTSRKSVIIHPYSHILFLHSTLQPFYIVEHKIHATWIQKKSSGESLLSLSRLLSLKS